MDHDSKAWSVVEDREFSDEDLTVSTYEIKRVDESSDQKTKLFLNPALKN